MAEPTAEEKERQQRKEDLRDAFCEGYKKAKKELADEAEAERKKKEDDEKKKKKSSWL